MAVQYPLFLKILTFDRNLISRAGEELTIGIVFQGKFKKSLNVKEKWITEMSQSPVQKVQNLPVRRVEIDLDKTDLKKALREMPVDVLYFAPLRGIELEAMADVATAFHICTLTGVAHYVDSGVAVGIGIKAQKPHIIINLPAAKAQGMDFSSKLLKLARVIQ